MERDMTDLIKFVIEMDPELVCKTCGTSDLVHYNYTILGCGAGNSFFRNHSLYGISNPPLTGRVFRNDRLGGIGVWCDACSSDTEMVHPDQAECKPVKSGPRATILYRNSQGEWEET